jgi:phosphoribosylanthranilate isomerase
MLDAAEDMNFVCVLAGKLTAENLPEVLTRFWLSVVDVASGIEDPETGFKDKKKTKAFIKVAHTRRLHPPY